MKKYLRKDIVQLLFTPVSITPLIDTIDTEDACFGLNASRPIAKGDLKWRDALLVAHRVNSNKFIRNLIFCPHNTWHCSTRMVLLSRLVRPKAVFLFTEEKLSFFIRFYRSDTSVIMQYANAGCFPQEYPCRSSTVSAQPLCRNSPVSCADVSVW